MKYKAGAGLNDDRETKLDLFYSWKLRNTVQKIADVIDFHCRRIANIQGQEGVSRRPSAAAGPGVSSWMRR